MTHQRKGNWIQTKTNKRFYLLDPRPEDIDIEDIAHALANKCRFSGFSLKYYSVAQHSVIVSNACNPVDAKWGLLHDASEACLMDLPTPFKIMPEFAVFKEQEDRLQHFIYEKFGLFGEEPESVYVADKTALVTERRDLMPSIESLQMNYKFEPFPDPIIPMLPEQAKQYFLDAYSKLFG